MNTTANELKLQVNLGQLVRTHMSNQSKQPYALEYRHFVVPIALRLLRVRDFENHPYGVRALVGALPQHRLPTASESLSEDAVLDDRTLGINRINSWQPALSKSTVLHGVYMADKRSRQISLDLRAA